MALKGAHLRVARPTHGALEWLLTGVSPLVADKFTTETEHFETKLARD